MDLIMQYIKRLERVNSILLSEPKTAMRPALQQRLQEQGALLEKLKSAISDLPKLD
jgi:hypothetical protein